MASTNFATGNALTVKLWGKTAFVDSVKDTLFGKLMGKSDKSIVQIKDELTKSEGDNVTFRLRSLPTGLGVEGDATLEGNEEGLVYQNFDLKIDMKRHATKVDLGMSQQRVNFDLRSEAKSALTDWWANYWDTCFIEMLSGHTSLTYHPGGTLGGNTPSAPTSGRIVYPGTVTAKNNLASTDKMSLTVIDKLVEKAKLAQPTMRPGNFDGKNQYVLVLHPYQVYDLRTNTSTGQWLDIQKAAMTASSKDNPIWSEALGVYNGVILTQNTRIKTYTDYGAGANVAAARALFLGAQAGVVAYGRGYEGAERMDWVEKMFDYNKKFGVGTSTIWGLQKTKFGSEDFATIAVDTAATAH